MPVVTSSGGGTTGYGNGWNHQLTSGHLTSSSGNGGGSGSPNGRLHPVLRTESLRSEISQDSILNNGLLNGNGPNKRVSFNRDVHVKRIPRGPGVNKGPGSLPLINGDADVLAILEHGKMRLGSNGGQVQPLRNGTSSSSSGHLWINPNPKVSKGWRGHSGREGNESVSPDYLREEAETILKSVQNISCVTSPYELRTQSLDRRDLRGRSRVPKSPNHNSSSNRVTEFLTRTMSPTRLWTSNSSKVNSTNTTNGNGTLEKSPQGIMRTSSNGYHNGNSSRSGVNSGGPASDPKFSSDSPISTISSAGGAGLEESPSSGLFIKKTGTGNLRSTVKENGVNFSKPLGSSSGGGSPSKEIIYTPVITGPHRNPTSLIKSESSSPSPPHQRISHFVYDKRSSANGNINSRVRQPLTLTPSFSSSSSSKPKYNVTTVLLNSSDETNYFPPLDTTGHHTIPTYSSDLYSYYRPSRSSSSPPLLSRRPDPEPEFTLRSRVGFGPDSSSPEIQESSETPDSSRAPSPNGFRTSQTQTVSMSTLPRVNQNQSPRPWRPKTTATTKINSLAHLKSQNGFSNRPRSPNSIRTKILSEPSTYIEQEFEKEQLMSSRNIPMRSADDYDGSNVKDQAKIQKPILSDTRVLGGKSGSGSSPEGGPKENFLSSLLRRKNKVMKLKVQEPQVTQLTSTPTPTYADPPKATVTDEKLGKKKRLKFFPSFLDKKFPSLTRKKSNDATSGSDTNTSQIEKRLRAGQYHPWPTPDHEKLTRKSSSSQPSSAPEKSTTVTSKKVAEPIVLQNAISHFEESPQNGWDHSTSDYRRDLAIANTHHAAITKFSTLDKYYTRSSPDINNSTYDGTKSLDRKILRGRSSSSSNKIPLSNLSTNNKSQRPHPGRRLEVFPPVSQSQGQGTLRHSSSEMSGLNLNNYQHPQGYRGRGVLRYFGDSDLEASSRRPHSQSTERRSFKRSIPHRYNGHGGWDPHENGEDSSSSGQGRSTSTSARKVWSPRTHRKSNYQGGGRKVSPGFGTNSSRSSPTETPKSNWSGSKLDESQGLNHHGPSPKSVYLHAPVIAEIPRPAPDPNFSLSSSSRTLSQDRLWSESQPQTGGGRGNRGLPRSMSMLLPWKSRPQNLDGSNNTNYRSKYYYKYGNSEPGILHSGGPSTKSTQMSWSNGKDYPLTSQGASKEDSDQGRSGVEGLTGHRPRTHKVSFEDHSLNLQGQHYREDDMMVPKSKGISNGPSLISRSNSMPKDARAPRWIPRRPYGS